jgi:hypothetical protein
MIDLSGGTSTATVSHSNSELRPRIAGIVAEAALPTLTPSVEPLKGAFENGKPHSTCLYRSPQPSTLRLQHEGAGNYQKGSRHEREKQPDDACNRKNPPKSNDGDALEWLLGLGDSNFLHTGSPLLQLVTSRASISFQLSVVSIEGKVTGGYPNGWVF